VIKAFTLRALLRLRENHPSAGLRTVVDDISAQFFGRGPSIRPRVVAFMNDVITLFEQELHLKVNRMKSAVVVDHGPVHDEIATALAGTGVQVCETARLLGAGLATKRKDGRQVARARFAGCSRRRTRFRRLLKAGARTWRLTTTGTNKARLWGAGAHGVTDGDLRRMRRAAAAEVSDAAKGGSVTMKLMMASESGTADPAYEANYAPLRCWAEAWHEAGARDSKAKPGRSGLQASFQKAVHRQHRATQPWRRVRGPAGAVVATLKRLEWRPTSPSLWTTDTGLVVNLDEVSPKVVKRLACEATWRWLCREAAREVGDESLAAGIWTKPVFAAMRGMPRPAASYTRRVAQGTVWTQARLWRAKRAESPVCPKGCGTPGTIVHRHAECYGEVELARQSHLTEGNRRAARLPQGCNFWNTLLLPDPLAGLEPPSANGELHWVGPCSADRVLEGTVYTDGSTFEPRSRQLARSGCALAQVDDFGTLLKGAWWALAAPTQTTPEAELVAMTEAVRNAGIRLDVIFDCLGLQTGLEKGRAWCESPKNMYACRWRAAWDLLDDRSWAIWSSGDRPDVEITFRWTPAHMARKAVDDGRISLRDWAGNREADLLAKWAAASHRFDQELADGLLNLEEEVRDVARWVGCIPGLVSHQGQWHDVHTCPPPPKTGPTTRKLGPRSPAEGGHDWFYRESARKWECRGCAARTPAPARRRRQRCSGGPTEPDDPSWVRVVGGIAAFAGPGHNLVHHGRLVWCTTCAHYTSQPARIRGLSDQCARGCPQARRTSRDRLRRGEFPVRAPGAAPEMLEGTPRRLGDIGSWHAVRSRAARSALDERPEDDGADSPHRLRALKVAEGFGDSADLRRGLLRTLGQIVVDDPEKYATPREHKRSHELADPEVPGADGRKKSAKTIYIGSAASMGREAVDLRGAVLTDGWPVDPELRGEYMIATDDGRARADAPGTKSPRRPDDDTESESPPYGPPVRPAAKRRRRQLVARPASRERGEVREWAAASAPVPPEWTTSKRRRVTWGPAEFYLI